MTVQDAPLFTASEIREARKWLGYLANDYKGEVPTRIHERGHGQSYGLGSSPPFAPEFIGYIGKLLCKDPDCAKCRRTEKAPVLDGYRAQANDRTRATRAFRKLRKFAPLEFDVLRLAVMYNLSIVEITKRLNDRAFEKGYPERYSVQGVVILAMAGVDKIRKFW